MREWHIVSQMETLFFLGHVIPALQMTFLENKGSGVRYYK